VPTAYLSPSQLKELTDVSVNPGAPQDGYPLVWNNTTSKWEARGIDRLEAPSPLFFRSGLTSQTIAERARIHPKGSFIFSGDGVGALVLAAFSAGVFANNDPTPRPLFRLVSRTNQIFGLLQFYYSLTDFNQNVYDTAQIYRVLFNGSIGGVFLLSTLAPAAPITPTFSVSVSPGDNALTVLGSFTSQGGIGWAMSMAFQWIPANFDLPLLSIEPP